jgi:hypothetical protein
MVVCLVLRLAFRYAAMAGRKGGCSSLYAALNAKTGEVDITDPVHSGAATDEQRYGDGVSVA